MDSTWFLTSYCTPKIWRVNLLLGGPCGTDGADFNDILSAPVLTPNDFMLINFIYEMLCTHAFFYQENAHMRVTF